MEDSRIEEREIDLIKMIKKALIQWRMIVIIAGIFALLIPIGVGLKNTRSVTSNSVTQTKTAKELNLEYNSIRITLSDYMQYRTLESAYNNSILNNVDFTTSTAITSTYQVKAKDNTQRIVAIAKAYSAIVSDNDFTQSIASVYTNDALASSIYDVCMINVITHETESNSDTAVIQVTALLPVGVSDETWSEVLTTSLEKYSESISESVGIHEVKLISVNSLENTSNRLSTIISGKITEIKTAQAAYNTAYNSLTTDGQAIVDEIIAKKGDEDFAVFNLSDAQNDLDEVWDRVNNYNEPYNLSVKSGFSHKWILAGVVIGVFVYFVILFATEIFSKRISSDDQLTMIFRTRHFGSIYEYPYITKFSRFVNDKKLYKKFRKSALIDKITIDLATKCSFSKTKDICIIVLADYNEKISSIVSEQSAILNSKGIKVKEIFIQDSISDISDEQFLGINNVFIHVISGKTSYSNALDLTKKLSEYDVEICGTDFIEVAL